MPEFTVYDTEGNLVYPQNSAPDEEVAELVDELASVPPWPVVYLDTNRDRLLQQFTAVRQREGFSTRPNNFYAVLEPSNIASSGLTTHADTLTSLFNRAFQRPDSPDRTVADPSIVAETWRECQPGNEVMEIAASELIARGEQQLWQVPDLVSGYGLAAEYAALDESGSIVISEESIRDRPEDVIIEIGGVDRPEPSQTTDEQLREEMADAYETILDDLVDQLTETVKNAVGHESERQRPPAQLAWIVITGQIYKQTEQQSILQKILTGDITAFIGEFSTHQEEYGKFKGVNETELKNVWDDVQEALNTDITTSETFRTDEQVIDLDQYETVLWERYRRYHLEAVERYAEQATGATDTELYAAWYNLQILQEEWIDGLEDPRWQISAWPVIRMLTGEQPVAKVEPVAETLENCTADVQEMIMDDRINELDDQVATFIDDCAEEFDFGRREMRHRYLDVSETFNRGDFLRVILSTYRRVLILILVVLLVLSGIAAASFLL